MGGETGSEVNRWRRGHEAAAARQRELMRAEGPRPAQAIAEAMAALDTLHAMGQWPGPRDPVSERAISEVRRRWARIQRHERRARLRGTLEGKKPGNR